MTCPDPTDPTRRTRGVPAGAWVALALVAGAAPWLAVATMPLLR